MASHELERGAVGSESRVYPCGRDSVPHIDFYDIRNDVQVDLVPDLPGQVEEGYTAVRMVFHFTGKGFQRGICIDMAEEVIMECA